MGNRSPAGRSGRRVFLAIGHPYPHRHSFTEAPSRSLFGRHSSSSRFIPAGWRRVTSFQRINCRFASHGGKILGTHPEFAHLPDSPTRPGTGRAFLGRQAFPPRMSRALVMTSIAMGRHAFPSLCLSEVCSQWRKPAGWTGGLTGLAALKDSARPSFKLPNYQFPHELPIQIPTANTRTPPTTT